MRTPANISQTTSDEPRDDQRSRPAEVFGKSGVPNDNAPKSRRPWVVLVVVVMAMIGAWFSLNERSSVSTRLLNLRDGRPKLLELGMGACDQCKRMKPVMKQAEQELSSSLEVRVLDVSREINERTAEHYKVRVIPTVLLVDGTGREMWRHEGFINFVTLRAAVMKKLPAEEK